MNTGIAPNLSAFTAKAKTLQNVLLTEVEVFQEIPGKPLNIKKYVAIWDTGATSSVITPKIVKELGLVSSGLIQVHGVAGSKDNAKTYLISLGLPNKIRVDSVRAAEVPQIVGEADMLIGMDIITLGDFSVTNVNNKTVFSFRIPSTKTIDYVEEINNPKATRFKKTGRNQPCPCGSGKKYKRCHGGK